jgi:hypothetical protein
VRGDKLRDYLESLFTARSDVTFLDGYRYGKHRLGSGGYTTQIVKLVAFEDVINMLGEGSCRVGLRRQPRSS